MRASPNAFPSLLHFVHVGEYIKCVQTLVVYYMLRATILPDLASYLAEPSQMKMQSIT